MAASFVCDSCNKPRRLNIKYPPIRKNCLRCRLASNKVMTMKVFSSIIHTEDNQEFQKQIEEWYLNDA